MGSPRNLHLHLRNPEWDREAVLEHDLFGDSPASEVFRRRLGDLVVCRRNRSDWFRSDRNHLELVGVHGGLHSDEMLVPLAACELARLRD